MWMDRPGFCYMHSCWHHRLQIILNYAMKSRLTYTLSAFATEFTWLAVRASKFITSIRTIFLSITSPNVWYTVFIRTSRRSTREVIFPTCRQCATCSSIFMQHQTLRAGTGDRNGIWPIGRGGWPNHAQMRAASLTAICATTVSWIHLQQSTIGLCNYSKPCVL